MTIDSLQQMPRVWRWALYALIALCITGVLPMAAVAAFGWLVEAFGAWILALLAAAAAAFVVWALSW